MGVFSRKLLEGLRVPKDLLYGDSSSMASSLAERELRTFDQSFKVSEIFAPNNREVLRGRIRRQRDIIQELGVDEEGASYILGRVSVGIREVNVEIAENFVGELYYKFTLDGEDLFGAR